MDTTSNNNLVMTVSNDLVSDNRVHKMATTLTKLGFHVTLVGRKMQSSSQLSPRAYKTKRLHLLFEKGPLFYACLNIRLFIFLLFTKSKIIWSNDLDTLPACYWAAKLLRKKLVYDSHELFTQVPELVNRPKVQKIWEKIEKRIVPELKNCITVCESIAVHYLVRYDVPFLVIRNVPLLYSSANEEKSQTNYTEKYIIYQGAVNIGRGIEEAILAMHQVDGAKLLVVGGGDLLETCKKLVLDQKLEHKVQFTGRIPFDQVMHYTKKASIGLSVEKDMGLNYRYALPNKLFDYLHAGVPVIASNLPEIANVINTYHVGITINETTPDNIALAIKQLLNNPTLLATYKENCLKAAPELCWENETKVIEVLMKTI